MNDQILDDFQATSKADEYPLWRYRVVGMLRLLIVVISLLIISSNYSDIVASIQAKDDQSYFVFMIILFCLFLVLPLFYHIRQAWAELRLKTGFGKKKIFRGFAIASSVIFIIIVTLALIIEIITNLGEGSSDSLFKIIGNLIGAAVFMSIFVPVLRMDTRY